LPALLQRLSGGSLHRNGSGFVRSRLHHLGSTDSAQQAGDGGLAGDGRIPEAVGHPDSVTVMALLIRNGEIVTADSRSRGDIYIADETITRIGVNLDVPPETEVVDASGKLVFPGFIDPHVHIYLPFMATFAKDTHKTASVAALVGGTTTYIEMVCPSR